MTSMRMRPKLPRQTHAQGCGRLRHFASSEKRCISCSIYNPVSARGVERDSLVYFHDYIHNPKTCQTLRQQMWGLWRRGFVSYRSWEWSIWRPSWSAEISTLAAIRACFQRDSKRQVDPGKYPYFIIFHLYITELTCFAWSELLGCMLTAVHVLFIFVLCFYCYEWYFGLLLLIRYARPISLCI